MFKFFLFLLKLFFSLFNRDILEIIQMYAIVKKENDILKRQIKRITFVRSDKIFFTLCRNLFASAKNHISIVKPETVLKWYHSLLKSFWTFDNHPHNPVGRPETPQYIKNLILDMKNDHFFWGNKRIRGELLKLGIELDKKTIAKIIRDFRKQGKIKKGLFWSKFLKAHCKSIFAMDLFTVDTLFNIRFYVFFIIHHQTREIIQFAISTNPAREFIRQQIIEFSNNVVENIKDTVYLIHDGSGEFMFDFLDYGIQNIKISAHAPNMNAIAERWIRSIRQECLDWFIIINRKQLYNILKEYVEYYNHYRPHQGIGQNIPKGYEPQSKGKIRAHPFLSGLHHHYYRIKMPDLELAA